MRQPDRTGDAQFVLHPLDEAREHHGGRRVVKAGGPGKVHERFVQRQRFDDGREVVHHRADLARDFDIPLHPAEDDHGFGAELERLEHRHGRANPLDSRDVAGGRDDAAAPAADDHGLVAQVGIVAFLDGGVECIAIHMRDGEIEEFRMRDDPRAAAGGAAAAGVEGRQAVAAEGGHSPIRAMPRGRRKRGVPTATKGCRSARRRRSPRGCCGRRPRRRSCRGGIRCRWTARGRDRPRPRRERPGPLRRRSANAV